jgi:hypothetical protein
MSFGVLLLCTGLSLLIRCSLQADPLELPYCVKESR